MHFIHLEVEFQVKHVGSDTDNVNIQVSVVIAFPESANVSVHSDAKPDARVAVPPEGEERESQTRGANDPRDRSPPLKTCHASFVATCSGAELLTNLPLVYMLDSDGTVLRCRRDRRQFAPYLSAADHRRTREGECYHIGGSVTEEGERAIFAAVNFVRDLCSREEAS
ncbi:MAG TPA: hypothetical protein VN181_04945 [Thermoanaerobaculia bacterium]|nr:hypothetical protein [Thermoanaerobaculia bacterium]